MSQLYELTYLISPELNEKEIAELSQKIEKLITETGKVKKSEPPKAVRLSYAIQKKRNAFLATLEFQTEPQNIEKLKKNLEKITEVLRFLLIKKEVSKKEKEPETKAKKVMKKQKAPVKQKVELKKIEKDLEKILDFPREDKPKA